MYRRRIKREELIAESYLNSLGIGDVVFEPDGNIPPDFLLKETTAIEVRRLNQHFFAKGEGRGLEEARIPLFGILQSTLAEFDPLYRGNSYWVSVRFRRPVGKSSANKRAIAKILTALLDKPLQLPCDLKVTESIGLHVFSSQPVEGKVFRFAGGTDRESGGWVLSEFTKNFKYCVEEKTRKVEDYRERYASWWLVLVDHIAHGFEENERKELRSMIGPIVSWDKVIVLDSLSGNSILEI
ncbi:MAG: hypothetical protein HY882_12510 [Deltaproteobacteria bacterium]|nr:hypothetical protein [Deltaproteobacteria bacterium]